MSYFNFSCTPFSIYMTYWNISYLCIRSLVLNLHNCLKRRTRAWNSHGNFCTVSIHEFWKSQNKGFLSVQVLSCFKVSFGNQSPLYLWVVCTGLESNAVRWTEIRALPYLWTLDLEAAPDTTTAIYTDSIMQFCIIIKSSHIRFEIK